MRSVPLALLVVLLAAAPAAQPAPAASAPTAHAVPFGSVGNEVALTLGGAGAQPARAPGAEAAWTVELVSAPAWVAATRGVAEAVVGPRRSASKAAGGDAAELGAEPVAEPSAEPVARVAFDVLPTAPVGVPGTLRLAVRDAEGTVVARKDVVVVVEAPALALGAPRPNPSRGVVRIPYALPEAGRARVRVVDVLGRTLAVLAEGEAAAGAHEARVAAGALAAGVYAVVLELEGDGGINRAVRRLTVAR